MGCPPQAYSDIINKKERYKMSDFEGMTIAQLKAYAEDNNVDLDGAKTKTSILAVLMDTKSSISSVEEGEDVIGSKTIVKEKRIPKSVTKPDESGVVTTKTADNFKGKIFEKTPNQDELKVAVYSEKNMAWISVGRINKGYNIVTEEASEKWLSRKGVRKATPQEVATHYGL